MQKGMIVEVTDTSVLYTHNFIAHNPVVFFPMKDAISSDKLYKKIIETSDWAGVTYQTLRGRLGMYVCGFNVHIPIGLPRGLLKKGNVDKPDRPNEVLSMAVIYFDQDDRYAIFDAATLKLPEEHNCPRCSKRRTEKGHACWWCGAP